MYLIVGLGNPGDKYRETRHNAGFLFIDYLHHFFASPPFSGQFKSEVSSFKKREEKIILAKPQAFMNVSGPEVQKLASFYNVDSQRILIAHDDLDIPLGKFKIDHGLGPALHNGITSIESALSESGFYRVRIGVDNRQAGVKIPGEAYVLGKFTGEELAILNGLFPHIVELLGNEYRTAFPFFK